MKKFLLVPQTQLPSPLLRKLGQLDVEMKTILERTDLGDYDKAQAYSATLEKYLDVKQQLSQPQSIPLIENKEKTKMPPNVNVDLNLFPKTFRSRANNLLSHIQNNTDLLWNERGEILVDGMPVAGSHIVDLVDDVIRVKKGKPGPVGASSFVEKLQSSNVPQTLIGNKERFTDADHSFLPSPRTRQDALFSTPRPRPPPRNPDWSPRGRGFAGNWGNQQGTGKKKKLVSKKKKNSVRKGVWVI